MNLDKKKIRRFQHSIWNYYRKNKRELPWRETKNPYKIFISEVMLQQTQVSRIVQKYEPFIRRFGDFSTLAKAPLAEVLSVWKGVGYNRRAIYLKAAAEMIVQKFQGALPRDPKILQTLPGIGPSTASATVVFSFNMPVVFVETNIRRVYIHHFLTDADGVSDREIYPIVELTMDKKNPRDWYWALMDYGTYLAKAIPNPNKKSKHYAVQSKFEGSNRQLRGKILRLLGENKFLSKERLYKLLDNDPRSAKIVKALSAEGFIVEKNNIFSIK